MALETYRQVPGASPSALERFVRRTTPASQAQEQCELCSARIPSEHRHLLEVATREVQCVCRPCSILFDCEAAGLGRHRLIPERRLSLEGFQMSDDHWSSLQIPVGIAYLVRDSRSRQVSASYPSPAGPTESTLACGAWERLEACNPALAGMKPDVEALLINRARGSRLHFVAPIDDCYRLVALIRTRWRGLSGGRQVWSEIDGFFDALKRRAKIVSAS